MLTPVSGTVHHSEQWTENAEVIFMYKMINKMYGTKMIENERYTNLYTTGRNTFTNVECPQLRLIRIKQIN